MLKSYIWDLDGTLLDSYGSIVSSLVTVAEESGEADSYENIMQAVKQGAVSTYLRELSTRCDQDYSGLYQRYREISHEKLGEITLIPGAKETLNALTERGADHYVYTHRGRSTGALLERLGLTSCFREIVTFEMGFRPKPSGEGVEYLVKKYGLEKADTAYIGDRSLDVYCAKDAGVKAVLYCPDNSCVSPTGLEDIVIRRLEDLLSNEVQTIRGRRLEHVYSRTFDRLEFLRETEQKVRSKIILESVVSMAERPETGVIVEGVETEAQKQGLKNMGCKMYQGFLFSRPVPVEELEELYRSKNEAKERS